MLCCQSRCAVLPAVDVTVLGTDYSLFTHVHHAYGLNDAFDRSVAHLLTAQQAHLSHDSLLQTSLHQTPLDQDDTANTAADTGTGSRRHALQAPAADNAGMAVSQQGDSLARERSRSMQQEGGVTNRADGGRFRGLQQDSIQLAEADGLPGDVQWATGNQPGATRPRDLQERIPVEHPCLHKGYSKEYEWVAHGVHVGPLPQVQLLGR